MDYSSSPTVLIKCKSYRHSFVSRKLSEYKLKAETRRIEWLGQLFQHTSVLPEKCQK